MRTQEPTPESFLPLSMAFFQILLALADDDRHGYAISKEVSSRTDGAVRLSPGTLYSNLKKLLEEGLIAEKSRRNARAGDDPRRRYYRLTPRGRAVAEAEVARLEGLIRDARAYGLRPRRS